jgi:hypothetical protein
VDLVPEQRRASASGITQTLNGVKLTVGPNVGSYAWNATKPDAVIPCGIAAIIFIASPPFYLMLQESETAPQSRSESQLDRENEWPAPEAQTTKEERVSVLM